MRSQTLWRTVVGLMRLGPLVCCKLLGVWIQLAKATVVGRGLPTVRAVPLQCSLSTCHLAILFTRSSCSVQLHQLSAVHGVTMAVLSMTNTMTVTILFSTRFAFTVPGQLLPWEPL